MTQFTNARDNRHILSQNAVFHIVITGHDKEEGNTYYSVHTGNPIAWLINKPYVSPLIRSIGSIQFNFYDYEINRNEWIYFSIAKQVLRDESLDKS